MRASSTKIFLKQRGKVITMSLSELRSARQILAAGDHVHSLLTSFAMNLLSPWKTTTRNWYQGRRPKKCDTQGSLQDRKTSDF